ncbi:MAG: VOC family protein [Desulfomonilia bacterium]
MIHSLHHIHVFASDIDRSIAFYQDCFNGQVIMDSLFAGSRNVFMRIGSGRIHFFSRKPKESGPGCIHHIGIQTDDIRATVKKLKEKGVVIENTIKDFGVWKYVMVSSPDGVLIELFQVNKEKIPNEYLSYFD